MFCALWGKASRVLLVQFLKSYPSGEIRALGTFANLQILRGKAGQGFSFSMSEEERAQTAKLHNRHLAQAIASVQAGGCDLLVLDEAVGALNHGLLNAEPLFAFLQHKPDALEIVLTGRNPAPELLALCDDVTEMKKQKHPFDQGIGAREGIEK